MRLNVQQGKGGGEALDKKARFILLVAGLVLTARVALVSRRREMRMDGKNLVEKLALDEMRLNMQQSMSAGEALDRKAQFILFVAASVLTLATTLQGTSFPIQSGRYGLVLVAAIVLDVTSILFVLTSLMPRSYRLAIASDWEEVDRQILGKTEREAILALLSGYVERVKQNGNINRRKARLHRLSLGLLMLTVVLIVSLAFLT